MQVIQIGETATLFRYEKLTRQAAHLGQQAFIGNAASTQLAIYHHLPCAIEIDHDVTALPANHMPDVNIDRSPR
jgi:hypothetical protein